MPEQYPALLVTKLYLPRPRPSHIPRPDLLAALDAGLERRLVLVAAAAGFGKTTLVAEWCTARAESVGWLSLDAGDNDPARFLAYIIAAVQTPRPTFGRELLAALTAPQPPALEHVLGSLVNQLAADPARLILVLDDYHVIDNAAVHHALTFLLDHLPPHITLVMLTRGDPPLPLARLRARGDLLEVRADALRFSPGDIARLLNDSLRLNLSPEALAALDARTEGWVAGLQLAGLALGGIQGDKETFVRQFSGGHRFVLDYLLEEVLSRQPDEVRHFLLRTSILQRLNADLCAAVTGKANIAVLLENLEHNNLFLIPLDAARYWYRYHHLFADLLLARLRVEEPTIISELHQRAAAWHEANDLPEEAIDYALAAGDYDHAARLISEPAAGVVRRGEVTTLLNWYRGFPVDIVRLHPRLCLTFGLAFALNGRWDEAETLLTYVESSAVADRPQEAIMLAYLVAAYRGNHARLMALASEARALPNPDAMTKTVLGLISGMQGDLRAACDLLNAAQLMGEQAEDYSLALTALFHQCRFHVFLGHLHRAHDLCQTALESARVIGDSALPMAAFAHVSLARILIEWNEAEKVAFHAQEAIRLAQLTGFVTGMVSSATMMLAESQLAQGEIDGAAKTAAEAITLAERYDPSGEVEWLRVYQARLWLVVGDKRGNEWLRTWASPPPSIFYPARIAAVTSARALLARRKTDEAIRLLTALTAEAADLLTVEALATLALARQLHGDSVNALTMLEMALNLGAPENRIRAFLDLGTPLAKLLGRFLEAHPQHDFARKVLAAFPDTGDIPSPAEPLSEREVEILRLIVAGKSNDEIAQTLVLAVSTVKWYINVLYGKLGVKTRAQAIALAHERRVLE